MVGEVPQRFRVIHDHGVDMNRNTDRAMLLPHVSLSLLIAACAAERNPEAIADTSDPVSAASQPDAGQEASLNGKPIFTTMNDPTKMGFEWTRNISGLPVYPNSTALLVNGMGLSSASALATVPLHPDFGTSYDGAPIGIPYEIVPGTQAKVPVTFTGAPDESDPGPYPIPPDAPIEGGPSSTGDRHVIIIDRDHWKLYETYSTYPVTQGGVITSWTAYSGSIFDLDTGAYRPACWTSGDAAGLPIFPGLVRYDEAVTQAVIPHALRFTLEHTRKAFIKPARHYASTSTSSTLPPMGMRIRLQASYSIDSFTPEVRVILQALKTYGMILADNGSNLYLTGTHDTRWSDSDLATMKQVTAANFEVVSLDSNQIATSCP
jgi:hypothetical protein